MRPAMMSANDEDLSVTEVGTVRCVIDSRGMHVYVNVKRNTAALIFLIRTHTCGQVHDAEVRV